MAYRFTPHLKTSEKSSHDKQVTKLIVENFQARGIPAMHVPSGLEGFDEACSIHDYVYRVQKRLNRLHHGRAYPTVLVHYQDDTVYFTTDTTKPQAPAGDVKPKDVLARKDPSVVSPAEMRASIDTVQKRLAACKHDSMMRLASTTSSETIHRLNAIYENSGQTEYDNVLAKGFPLYIQLSNYTYIKDHVCDKAFIDAINTNLAPTGWCSSGFVGNGEILISPVEDQKTAEAPLTVEEQKTAQAPLTVETAPLSVADAAQEIYTRLVCLTKKDCVVTLNHCTKRLVFRLYDGSFREAVNHELSKACWSAWSMQWCVVYSNIEGCYVQVAPVPK
jgi:hypothetical protein